MVNGFSQLFQNWWPRPNAGDKGELSRSRSREPTKGVGGQKRHHRPPGQPLTAHAFSGLRLVCGDAKSGRRSLDVTGSRQSCTRGGPCAQWEKLKENSALNPRVFDLEDGVWVEEKETGFSFLCLVPTQASGLLVCPVPIWGGERTPRDRGQDGQRSTWQPTRSLQSSKEQPGLSLPGTAHPSGVNAGQRSSIKGLQWHQRTPTPKEEGERHEEDRTCPFLLQAPLGGGGRKRRWSEFCSDASSAFWGQRVTWSFLELNIHTASHSTYSSTSEQCLTTGGHHCLLVHSLLTAAGLPGCLHWPPHVAGGWCTCNRTRGSDGVPLPRQVIRTSWLPSWLLSSPPLDHVLRGSQPHVLSNPMEKPKR